MTDVEMMPNPALEGSANGYAVAVPSRSTRRRPLSSVVRRISRDLTQRLDSHPDFLR